MKNEELLRLEAALAEATREHDDRCRQHFEHPGLSTRLAVEVARHRMVQARVALTKAHNRARDGQKGDA